MCCSNIFARIQLSFGILLSAQTAWSCLLIPLFDVCTVHRRTGDVVLEDDVTLLTLDGHVLGHKHVDASLDDHAHVDVAATIGCQVFLAEFARELAIGELHFSKIGDLQGHIIYVMMASVQLLAKQAGAKWSQHLEYDLKQFNTTYEVSQGSRTRLQYFSIVGIVNAKFPWRFDGRSCRGGNGKVNGGLHIGRLGVGRGLVLHRSSLSQ